MYTNLVALSEWCGGSAGYPRPVVSFGAVSAAVTPPARPIEHMATAREVRGLQCDVGMGHHTHIDVPTKLRRVSE